MPQADRQAWDQAHGAGWLYSAGTAAAEREADGYAGRFLARYGYPHSKVVRFLHDEQDGRRGGPERPVAGDD